MEYRELGRTGLRLSALGFGASSLGGVFHSLREEDGVQAVLAAVEGGINFIDVSPYYGYLRAEKVLGKALRQLPRDKFILSTKVGRYGSDEGGNSWDYSAKRVHDSVFESMERLGVDYIDLINVHDIEFADLDLVCAETLPALVELRQQGVVGHVGITDLQLENLKYVVEHVPDGTVESVLNFCHYCLCDDQLLDFLDFFESRGIGVINASPLSMGLLSQRGAPAWHPAPAALQEACRRAVAHCSAAGYPIERLAVEFSVSEPRISSTLFSTTRAENVRANLAWAAGSPDLDLLSQVREILGDAFRLSWKNT